jgi:16S rRNA (guanine966-N2)-methyltransferase
MSSRSNQVRIIAGQWRSRKLSFPDSKGLRPTSDRIRETLFNWLAPALPGACCLDLFAGSGALGFEAASRGAARVVMVERDREAAQALRDNRENLSAVSTEIVQQDAESFLSCCTDRFDVVFLDPPFHDERLLQTSILSLMKADLLNPGAGIYVESTAKSDMPEMPESWAMDRQKKAGQVVYRLYRYTKA